MLWANSKVAIGAFFLAMIYSRFLSVETKQDTYEVTQDAIVVQMTEAIELLRQNDDKNVEYLNGRIDKKTKRIEEDVTNIYKEIEMLKQTTHKE